MNNTYYQLDERNQTFSIDAHYREWVYEGYIEKVVKPKLNALIGEYLLNNLPQNEWTAIKPTIQWPSDEDLLIAKEKWESGRPLPKVSVRVRFDFEAIYYKSRH